jgi:hypothetical protein
MKLPPSKGMYDVRAGTDRKIMPNLPSPMQRILQKNLDVREEKHNQRCPPHLPPGKTSRGCGGITLE